jgi:hypothetical protein
MTHDFKIDYSGTVRLGSGVLGAIETLGPLILLPGTWSGTGFNTIWRPVRLNLSPFLQLNLTQEQLTFDFIGAPVPNRGFEQADIVLNGLRYLQQITDNSGFAPPNGGGALHMETGFWVAVPATTAPVAPMMLVRAASVPHGNAVLAAASFESAAGAPVIPVASITPFTAAGVLDPFGQQDLSTASDFRTQPLPVGITQDLLNDPNLLLRERIASQQVIETTRIDVSTEPAGFGVANIPFLTENAEVSRVTATFWIETIRRNDGSTFMQLQYSQTIEIVFHGLIWPHVSVANLVLTGA